MDAVTGAWRLEIVMGNCLLEVEGPGVDLKIALVATIRCGVEVSVQVGLDDEAAV